MKNAILYNIITADVQRRYSNEYNKKKNTAFAVPKTKKYEQNLLLILL